MPFYDSHTHTRLCGHALGEPIDYAKTAERVGLTGFIVTDHNPFASGWESGLRMRPHEFDEYMAMIEYARAAYKGVVDVRAGVECDYFPGMGAEIKSVVKAADFDYVLGSVHCNMRSYLDTFFEGDVLAYTRLYFEHMGDAAETGFFDAISHPDVPKFMWPREWDFERIRPNVCRFLDRVSSAGIALELNTSGVLKPYPEMNPGREMLELMQERAIPVVLGSDAHEPRRTGDGFVEALRLLQGIGYTQVSYYLNRKRVDENITAVLLELGS
ncbi:histidinol-phosphatase [Verrucomicrobiota bacterium]